MQSWPYQSKLARVRINGGGIQKVIKHLDKRNCKPIVNVMNNECSKAVEQYINSTNIDIELRLPKNCCLDGPEEREREREKLKHINIISLAHL